jgi:guanylate kinase
MAGSNIGVFPHDPLLIVLSSPSGAGKSTMCRRLLAWDQRLWMSISVTTRPIRAGEIAGQDYHFTDTAGFAAIEADGGFLESARVHDNLYGTPRRPVEDATARGQDVLFDIDWQGAQQVFQKLGDALLRVFLLPPSMAELEQRLRSRAQDSDMVIAKRLAKARDEISHWAEYDYVLVNDNPDHCFERLAAIIAAERLRRTRQRGLVEFIKTLI